ncbi:hypothetical protein F2Q68_00035881 [Brassica cretica]|uniref:Uncharacterized protein n=1 Tax=Brassica cretica TaxID=69181 RepID=A0A8S9H6N5_BRACR|nr:hypothetical protein F2Q68_00035881 [Brassica cretica]
MVTTEVSTAVSGMKPTSPPPESDGSTDFLDNDRLKESFSSGSLDFDDWTLLISEVETSFPFTMLSCWSFPCAMAIGGSMLTIRYSYAL